jgi:hypothetical protein
MGIFLPDACSELYGQSEYRNGKPVITLYHKIRILLTFLCLCKNEAVWQESINQLTILILEKRSTENQNIVPSEKQNFPVQFLTPYP